MHSRLHNDDSAERVSPTAVEKSREDAVKQVHAHARNKNTWQSAAARTSLVLTLKAARAGLEVRRCM